MALNKIFVDSVDRDLQLQARLIPSHLDVIRSERDLELWRALDHDLNIVPADGSNGFSPRPFTIRKVHKSETETEDFRVLQKEVMILGQKYYVNIESSLFEKDDLARTILMIQLGIFVFLLLGATCINYFINKKVWKPFYNNLYFLKQYNPGHEVAGEPERLKIEEFDQLNQSIHQLSLRVHKSYNLQKEFLENVSHELQTPLTVLKFKLELLLQEQGLNKSQSLLIGDMYREIEHIQELNNNFLLLSKIDNKQFAITDKVNFTAILHELMEELSFLMEAKMQTVTASFGVSDVYLQGNRPLVKILAKNLMVNAIQYAPSSAVIKLMLTEKSFTVINPGEPINISEDQLFERVIKKSFAKNKQNGNGLGLSIIKNIAVYHHSTIRYAYSPGFHYFIFEWENK